MRRVYVYVDGFNLYHAIDDLGDDSLKWLDLWSLSESLIAQNETLYAVKYFSAYATWHASGYARVNGGAKLVHQGGGKLVHLG